MSLMRILPAAEAKDVLSRRDNRLDEAAEIVKPIIEGVRSKGDAALREFAAKFDGFDRASFRLSAGELREAHQAVSGDFLEAVRASAKNIAAMSRLQMPQPFNREIAPGQFVGQIVRPLDTIAAYIPGGRYPLPSTVLMTGIPAQVAGVKHIWVTTPKPNRETLAAACELGVDNVALLGGAQAIAAFAFGTETIPRADRIVGPGNIYVSAAKKLLAGEVGIDFVAGPTEILLIANEGNPAWIAADMLAQAEHDTDAAAYLLTTSRTLAMQVGEEIERQIRSLPTGAVAKAAIQNNSAILVTETDAESIDIANDLAPEHLWLPSRDLLDQIQNAGSVFIGAYSPEAAGDYLTGPNHVLPTNGGGRRSGGLSVMDFVKIVTVQELRPEALQRLAPSATTLARVEGLEAHARSIEIRL